MAQTTSALTPRGIGQIAITVRDIERATAWYRDVLGLQFLFSAPPGLAFFDCGGLRLMLSEPETPNTGTASSVIYYRVEDIVASHREMTARGVVFEDEPHLIVKMNDVELWLVSLKDPEGNRLALMCEKKV